MFAAGQRWLLVYVRFRAAESPSVARLHRANGEETGWQALLTLNDCLLQLHPHIQSVIGLDEVPSAIESILKRKSIGKTVVRMDL